MRNNKHYLLLLLPLLLFACKGTDEPSLNFETITVDKTVMLSNDENSPRCQVHLKLLQPTAENGDRTQIINEALMSRLLRGARLTDGGREVCRRLYHQLQEHDAAPV